MVSAYNSEVVGVPLLCDRSKYASRARTTLHLVEPSSIYEIRLIIVNENYSSGLLRDVQDDTVMTVFSMLTLCRSHESRR
jgi:hypothetical protein